MENSCCCCTCVPSGKVGVIEKLGRFSRLAHPGMNCVVWPVEYMRGTLSTRVQQLDVKTFTKIVRESYVPSFSEFTDGTVKTNDPNLLMQFKAAFRL